MMAWPPQGWRLGLAPLPDGLGLRLSYGESGETALRFDLLRKWTGDLKAVFALVHRW